MDESDPTGPAGRCYRCFWPRALCWCGSVTPMATRSRIVLLMHPKEFKEMRTGTGRLTRLCLEESEIVVGVGFDRDDRVNELIDAPGNFPVLLYPGQGARLLPGGLGPSDLTGRRLVVFVLDATWSQARKMLRMSSRLGALPRVMFPPGEPSRFVIKRQPHEGCLSTIEAVDRLLGALDEAGLDRYPDRTQLPAVLARLQAFLMAKAADPGLTGYRRKPYAASCGVAVAGPAGRRRTVFRMPARDVSGRQNPPG